MLGDAADLIRGRRLYLRVSPNEGEGSACEPEAALVGKVNRHLVGNG